MFETRKCRFSSVLQKAKELGFQTIGLCTISCSQRNFPSDLGAHIALSKTHTILHARTILSIFFIVGSIRKFLEANQREIVILCLEQNECGIYEVLAPLYFPRDQLEESATRLWQLPKNISAITGELSISDRQIRITRNPQHTIMMLGSEFYKFFYHDNVTDVCLFEKPC